MMQNGVRTSKFGGRSDQLCVWCMQSIFVEFLDKNDVFGQNAFANEEVVTANAFEMVFGYGRSQDEHQCGLWTLFACLFANNNWMNLFSVFQTLHVILGEVCGESSNVKQIRPKTNSAASLQTLKPFFHTGKRSKRKQAVYCHAHACTIVPLLFLLFRLFKWQRQHVDIHAAIHIQTS